MLKNAPFALKIKISLAVYYLDRDTLFHMLTGYFSLYERKIETLV
jgi:hypothetical protein